MSIRLYRGRTPIAWRVARTSFSSRPVSEASLTSEKPANFNARKFSASSGSPNFSTFFSIAMISEIRSRNHGSILLASCTSLTLMPSRNACPTTSRRSGVGVPSAPRNTLRSSPLPRPSISISSRPESPVSRERKAFCSDSAKLRPIAIDSPTDFIAVVSVGSAPGNFSKAKRGILVTI